MLRHSTPYLPASTLWSAGSEGSPEEGTKLVATVTLMLMESFCVPLQLDSYVAKIEIL